MAKLYFKVEADVDKIIKLRDEIARLRSELKTMTPESSTVKVADLENRLQSCTTQMHQMAAGAAQAAYELGNDFKSKIYQSSQVVNDLSAEIIKQKDIMRGTRDDVDKLTTQYRKMSDLDPRKSAVRTELEKSRAALSEQKYALSELQSQQASARLEVKKLKDEYSAFGKESESTNTQLDSMSLSLGKMLAALGGIAALKSFGSAVIETRGRMQNLEKSFETLLGSKEKADTMLKDIREYAVKSPLTLKDLTSATQTLLGFNIEADKSLPILKNIGDVAMGDSGKFQSLSLAFAQMSAAGKLMGQDLNQMINAGFNPLKEISRTTGKSIGELKDQMSKGAISAEMVTDAFRTATAEGGKYYGMTENASKGIISAQSNFQNAIDEMFNSIGQSSEKAITATYNMGSALVSHYDKIGKAIAALVATYGTYKAALIVSNALEENIASKRMLVTVLGTVRKAQLALNAAMSVNPYVLLTTVVVGLVGTVWALNDRMSEGEKTAALLRGRIKEITDASGERLKKAKDLIAAARDETKAEADRALALAKLKSLYPSLFSDLDTESVKVLNLTESYKSLNEEESKRVGAAKQKELNNLYREKQSLEDSIAGDKASGTGKSLYNASKSREQLKAVNEQIKELEAEKKEYLDAQETLSGAVKIKNKAYWEKIKKDAEAAIDAMDVSLKGSADWKSKEKIIAEAQAQIDKYSKDKTVEKEEPKYLAALESKDKKIEYIAAQARVDAMKEGSARIIEQMKVDFDKQKDEIDRQESEYLAQKVKSAKAAFEADSKNKGKKFDVSSVSLSEDEKSLFSEIRNNAEVKNDLAVSEYYSSLLEKYETYEQEKQRISEKYDDDIKAMKSQTGVDNSANIAMAEKAKKEALSAVDMKEFEKSIDWTAIFGNLDNVSVDGLKAYRDAVKKYIDDMNGSLSAVDTKALVKAFDSLEQKISEKEPFSVLAEGISDYKKASSDVEKYQKEVNRLLAEGKKGSEEYQKAIENLTNAENTRSKSSTKVNTAIDGIATKGLEVVDAGNAMLDLFNSLGISMSDDANKVVGGFGKALEGLSEMDITKPMSLITGTLKVTAGYVDALTGVFGASGATKRDDLTPILAKYETLINALDKAIERQEELLAESSGTEAVDTYKQSIKNINQQIEAYKTLAKARASSGSSWGSHSYGYRTDKNLQQYYTGISTLLNKPIDSLEDIYKLSGSELEMIQERMPAAWAALDSGIRGYLESIIECETALEDMKDKLNEALTGISFDSVEDDFSNMLSDMDSSTKDFAENFEEYMRNAIIRMMMTNTYSKRLQDWYDNFAESAADGTLTEAEAESAKKEYNAIVSDAIAERDQLLSALGESYSSQTGSSSGFATASQESIDELNGRFAALQQSNEEIKVQSYLHTEYLGKTSNIADEMRNMMVDAYMDIADIKDNTGQTVVKLSGVITELKELKNKI